MRSGTVTAAHWYRKPGRLMPPPETRGQSTPARVVQSTIAVSPFGVNRLDDVDSAFRAATRPLAI